MRTIRGSRDRSSDVAAMTGIEESQLGSRKEIGTGGMARVYSLPELFLPEAPNASWVYKKFRPKVRPIAPYGLESLVRLLDEMPQAQNAAMQRHFNWPVRVVTDQEAGASGVILPLLADSYFLDLRLSSGVRKRKPAELQFLFMDAHYCARVGAPNVDDAQRREICRSLAYAMALLDRASVVYGDLSARNVLFRVSPRPGVMLVDCDAARCQGDTAAFGKQPHSPDWEPPEAVRARKRRDGASYSIQNKATDRYKLGVAILRILTPGEGCSVNTDPSAAKRLLPKRIYTLLVRSLSDDPDARPAAKTWYEDMTR